MLVMTRREGEGVQIGEDVQVYVIEDKKGKLRIGIDAPKTTNIRRLEIEDNRAVIDKYCK